MNSTRHFILSFQLIGRLALSALGFALPFLAFGQLSLSYDAVSPHCFEWTDGAIKVNVSGGQEPYTYNWSNGYDNFFLSGIPAGTYGVTVTDAAGEIATADIVLTHPDLLEGNISIVDTCGGTGEVLAIATGGTAPYSFNWDDGSIGSAATLSTGFHCMTITDANGCIAVRCLVVPAALSLDFDVKGLPCHNYCDASVEALGTGGTGPYSYEWSNGANESVNQNLDAGNFAVTLTDANGCTISGSATVLNPEPIVIDLAVTLPACGSGGTGSATASVSGGSGPYNYYWSNGAIGESVSGLYPGSYSLTVTDFNGCIEISDFIIVEESEAAISVSATPSSGCGAPDGTATVVINGGTGPFNINWSSGDHTETATGLAPGNYTVLVTDALGCGATAQVTVGGSTAIMLMISGVNGGCSANASANAMVTAGTGTPPFSYLWNTGQTTQIINNLAPGVFSVTVTDAAGCTATDEVTVLSIADINVSTTVTPVSCYNGTDGTATAVATGSAGPFSYEWSNGATTATISNLSASAYFVTVTDVSSGCTATINANVVQPSELVATASGTETGCSGHGGTATASASGGTAPYSFAWSNGSSDATISGLAEGNYEVTVTDVNACTAVATAYVSSGGGSLVTVGIAVDHALSSAGNDGALTASANGGSAPYTYLWSTGDETASISGLPAGIYSVTVTDAQGCTGETSISLYKPSCIGDRIWHDVNRNGCQDPGEFGIGNITLTLTGTDIFGNTVSVTKKTAPNGQYLFDNLAPGTYKVQMAVPPGYAVSPANACGNNNSDSDFSFTGASNSIALGEGECIKFIDGGLFDECLNVTDLGEICCDQVLCGPGNFPGTIYSVKPASGGGSPIEYMWLYAEGTIESHPFAFWKMVPDAHGESYTPGRLYETTRFIRCAKSVNCTEWLEDGPVTIIVEDNAVAEISGEALVCVGDVTTYTALDNGPGSSYSWTFGPWGTPLVSTGKSVSVKWHTAGISYITLTVTANGCTSYVELPIAISKSPIICGNSLIINTGSQNGNVLVQWETERVEGNFRFVVQRSTDGESFANIGIVEQAAGEGMHAYSFEDAEQGLDGAYYRLEILEDSDHLMFSNIERGSQFSDNASFAIYPNPVADAFTVEYSGAVKSAVQMEIFGLDGRLVKEQKLPEGKVVQSVDFSGFASGSYFVRFTFNDGEREVLKFVKR